MMATAKPKPAPKPAPQNTAAPPKGTGLKITPDRAHEALEVLAAYIDERCVMIKDKTRLGNVVGAIKVMHTINQLKEAIGTRLKSPLEEAYNTMRFNVVPEFMEDEEITKITVEDVGRVNITDDLRVVVEDKAAFHEWLVENDLEDMIVDTVNAATLTAFVRNRIKEGKSQDGKGLPTDKILKVTPFVRAAITKA
jgi:hypothetical protein